MALRDYFLGNKYVPVVVYKILATLQNHSLPTPLVFNSTHSIYKLSIIQLICFISFRQSHDCHLWSADIESRSGYVFHVCSQVLNIKYYIYMKYKHGYKHIYNHTYF